MAQLGKMFAATRPAANSLPVVAVNVAGELLEIATKLDVVGPTLAGALRLHAAELTIAAKVAPAPANAGLAQLCAAALEAHAEINDLRNGFLDNSCVPDESGVPDPATLDARDRAELDRLDAMLARLDAAIKATEGAK
ncbi:MAG: hypothetical protein WD871_01610 [Xanthobacteraceae bacterium]